MALLGVELALQVVHAALLVVERRSISLGLESFGETLVVAVELGLDGLSAIAHDLTVDALALVSLAALACFVFGAFSDRVTRPWPAIVWVVRPSASHQKGSSSTSM